VLSAAAAGSPPQAVHTAVAGAVTSVSADPAVQGLPTSGFATVVSVGPGNAITTASGWLSRPVPGAVYPLISAGQAARALRAAVTRTAPRGGNPPRGACPVKPGVGCAGAGPVRLLRVTGAVYGLALGYDGTGTGSRPVLVPAWLVRVAGTGEPIPEVAVSPRYLAAR
jgi:hypothetical protein